MQSACPAPSHSTSSLDRMDSYCNRAVLCLEESLQTPRNDAPFLATDRTPSPSPSPRFRGGWAQLGQSSELQQDTVHTPRGHAEAGHASGNSPPLLLPPSRAPWGMVSRTPSRTPSPMARAPRSVPQTSKLVADAIPKLNLMATCPKQQSRDMPPGVWHDAAQRTVVAPATAFPTTLPPPPPPPPMPPLAMPLHGGQSHTQCAPSEPQMPIEVVSKGSVGHPFSCAEACKYARKPRGCKDGADCNRCHQCEWNRYGKNRASNKQKLCNSF
mmetsp:Transcript_126423/g.319269  ORF Transcript_126423/g.319269 Transcript_126423/m.319269 type:complete len:270 (-) Transcript_126423:101-910(-)